MAKMKVPKGTFEIASLLDERRKFPSLECLTAEQIKEVRNRVTNLRSFHSKAKLAYQTVNYFGDWIAERGFKERDLFDDSPITEKKFFYKDPWQGSSMIIVNQGKKPLTEGFRLIVSHADSPCLRVKPRPIHMEEKSSEDIYNYLGVRLSTIPHGGIITSNWVGQQVKIMGYTLDKNRKRREITFPGFVGINSVHVESEGTQDLRETSPEASLEIITGYAGIRKFLKTLNLDNLDDFAASRLWAVPTNEMELLDESSMNLLVGYGHDNRTTTFSAVDSIARIQNPEYASIVWVVDNEEIFDPAPSGSRGNGLEMIIDKMLESQEKKEGRKISVNEKNMLYVKSKMITGDVTFAPYGPDAPVSDYRSAAKIGLGTVIEGGDIQGYNPLFIRDLIGLTKQLTKKKPRLCHQVTGQFYDQDMVSLWFSPEDQSSFPKKGVSNSWVAIPCACLHSAVEAICPGDEYATSELYRRFFESNVKTFKK